MGTCFVIFFIFYLFCGCSVFLSYVISDKKLELVILVPTPFSLFKSLWIEIWFFKFSMIWVFFGIGYFSFHFRFHIFGIGIGYFSSCGAVQMLNISIGFKYNRVVFRFGDVWLVHTLYMFKYNRVLVNILPTSTSKRILKFSFCCLPPSPILSYILSYPFLLTWFLTYSYEEH